MLALATALKDTSRLRRGETNSPAAAPSFSCAAPCPSSYRSSRSCPRPASSSGSSVTSPCRSESGAVPKQRNITLQGEQQGLLTELTARDDFRDSQQDMVFPRVYPAGGGRRRGRTAAAACEAVRGPRSRAAHGALKNEDYILLSKDRLHYIVRKECTAARGIVASGGAFLYRARGARAQSRRRRCPLRRSRAWRAYRSSPAERVSSTSNSSSRSSCSRSSSRSSSSCRSSTRSSNLERGGHRVVHLTVNTSARVNTSSSSRRSTCSRISTTTTTTTTTSTTTTTTTRIMCSPTAAAAARMTRRCCWRGASQPGFP